MKPLETRTPPLKNMIREQRGRRRRAAHWECKKCSSLRVLGGGWLMMISHGVKISIAGGVRKMVPVSIQCMTGLSYINSSPQISSVIRQTQDARVYSMIVEQNWIMI